jgi:hypothetical protein
MTTETTTIPEQTIEELIDELYITSGAWLEDWLASLDATDEDAA